MQMSDDGVFESVGDLPIEYNEWGVANYFGDRIELHRDLCLPEWNELKSFCLEHEMLHHKQHLQQSVLAGLTGNIGAEFDALKFNILLLQFMYNRPKTWTQLLPFNYDKKRNTLFVDWTHLLLYTLFGLFVFWVLEFAKWWI